MIKFVQAAGLEDYLPDPVEARRKEREVVAALSSIFLGKTRAEWLPILMKADTCVTPVNEIDELFDDPQIIARKMVVELTILLWGKSNRSVFLSRCPKHNLSSAVSHRSPGKIRKKFYLNWATPKRTSRK